MKYRAALIAFALLCSARTQAIGQSTSIEIRLRSPVPVQADLIRIVDIADVVGGTSSMRRVINALDVDLLESRQYSTTIDARSVRVRCLLAGLKSDQIRVTGPARCLAYRGVPARSTSLTRPRVQDPETAVVEAIRDSIAKIWKTDAAKIDVWLTKPIAEFQADPPTIDRSMVRVYPPGDPKAGEMTLTVMVRPKLSRPIRATVNANVTFADAETESGKPIIRQASLSTTRNGRSRNTSQAEIVIRPNDAVQLTAIRGSLRVVVTDAKALQSGRKGDTIRLRNPKSGQIVRGRVVSRSQVVIEL